jgi:hypothetical protein
MRCGNTDNSTIGYQRSPPHPHYANTCRYMEHCVERGEGLGDSFIIRNLSGIIQWHSSEDHLGGGWVGAYTYKSSCSIDIRQQQPAARFSYPTKNYLSSLLFAKKTSCHFLPLSHTHTRKHSYIPVPTTTNNNTMRLTAIINLPVVFLALVIGAAAAPVGGSNVYQLAESPSYCLFFYPLSHLTTFIVV